MRTNDERGGSIGKYMAIYQQIKTESGKTSTKPDEIKLMKHDAKNRYLAVAFTLNADKSRYGPMIEYIENEFLRRTSVSSKTGTYPLTVTEAYYYLYNYKKDPRNVMRLIGGNDNTNAGMAFVQRGKRNPDDSLSLYWFGASESSGFRFPL